MLLVQHQTDGGLLVRRQPGEELQPDCPTGTVQQSGSVFLTVVCADETMNSEVYKDTVDANLQ